LLGQFKKKPRLVRGFLLAFPDGVEQVTSWLMSRALPTGRSEVVTNTKRQSVVLREVTAQSKELKE
jgi:hypothetical protein